MSLAPVGSSGGHGADAGRQPASASEPWTATGSIGSRPALDSDPDEHLQVVGADSSDEGRFGHVQPYSQGDVSDNSAQARPVAIGSKEQPSDGSSRDDTFGSMVIVDELGADGGVHGG